MIRLFKGSILHYSAALERLERGVKQYKLSSDLMDKINALPLVPILLSIEEYADMRSIAKLIIIADIAEEKRAEASEHTNEESNKLLKSEIKFLRVLLDINLTKPLGSSKSTLIRNQEIVDKCYELEKKHIQPRSIYETVSKDYPTLSSHAIKKIRLSPDAPTPTSLKK